jgi:fermentation-respiration switch protein FrsA (DUF1100 family)
LRRLPKILGGVFAAYGLVVLGMYAGQRRLLYFPDPSRVSPAARGLVGVEERELETADGERIVVWYGKASPGAPTFLYFHGNGGNLSVRSPRFERFMREGWGVFMMSYRGYSGSSGSPTEANNLADARIAYDALAREGVHPSAVIIYGESLGTGVAVRIAADRESAGLVLEAPYTSVADVAADTYPFLPVRSLVIDRYESKKYIANVRVPLLVLHGDRDDVIPIGFGRELFGLGNEPKRFALFAGAGHSNLYLDGNTALDEVRRYVRELRRP